MINLNDIKKILEKSNLKYKETINGLIIFKESDDVIPQIIDVLKTFGVKQDDIVISDEGTLINSKLYDARKLQILLSPYYPLDKLIVKDKYQLLIKDLFIDGLNEGADGSIDDLGDTPVDSIVTIDDLAQLLDNEFPNIEIFIISDNEIELPYSDELVDFFKSIENDLENFEVDIYDDKIIVKGQ